MESEKKVMEYNAYFEDIHEHIMDVLKVATIEVTMAVAWFTDPEIYELLCNKAEEGKKVRLLLIDDNINTGKNGLDFGRLKELGGEVHFVPLAGHKSSLMHNKFVVIDRATVLTGSYNWTKKARRNSENITVINSDLSFARQYLEEFENLLIKYGFGKSKTGLPVNPQLIARRLDLIKNFLLLDEFDNAVKQAELLKAYKGNNKLNDILSLIERADFEVAIEGIDRFSIESLAIASYIDPEIATLSLELKYLEIELTVLSEKKVEIEKEIYQFSQISQTLLGVMINEYLLLRRNKLEKEKNLHKEKKREFEEADKEYRDYKKEFDESKDDLLIKLNDDAKKELKDLYKRASVLCHPDKVVEKDKEMAHSVFVELQKAYRENDLANVRRIYETLKKGNMFVDIADVVTEKDSLLTTVLQIRLKVEKMMTEIDEMVKSDTYITIIDHADIPEYFDVQKRALTAEINKLKAELS